MFQLYQSVFQVQLDELYRLMYLVLLKYATNFFRAIDGATIVDNFLVEDIIQLNTSIDRAHRVVLGTHFGTVGTRP